MATAWSTLNDEGYWSGDDERPLPVAKRQKTKHVTNADQDITSDLQIAELCLLFAKFTLYERPPVPSMIEEPPSLESLTIESPPSPPLIEETSRPIPILIITDDNDTAESTASQLDYAQSVGRARNVDLITRYGERPGPGETESYGSPAFLHPIWQSRLSKYFSYKEPEYDHPFLYRCRYFPHERYPHV